MPPFFLFVDAASLWRPEIVKASLPEVNQFTGNCFRMVRIVLKITFLGLRYPGQRPECPSLSYYGSWRRLKNDLYPLQEPRTEQNHISTTQVEVTVQTPLIIFTWRLRCMSAKRVIQRIKVTLKCNFSSTVKSPYPNWPCYTLSKTESMRDTLF